MKKLSLSQTKFYRTFKSIEQRCKNNKSSKYYCYGARGIICEWKNFYEFKKDMHKSYLKHVKKHGELKTTIERINNDGNYCKENCRWATPEEQAVNKTINRFIVFKNEKRHLGYWSRKFKINSTTISSRIDDLGWDIETALTKPVRRKLITFNGKRLKLSEWARLLKINEKTLSNRINYGWSIKKCFKKK